MLASLIVAFIFFYRLTLVLHVTTLSSALIKRATWHYMLCHCVQTGYVALWSVAIFVVRFHWAVMLAGKQELMPCGELTTFSANTIAFREIERSRP